MNYYLNNMRNSAFLSAIVLVFLVLACGSHAGGAGKIRVYGELKDLQRDSVFVYRIIGNEMLPIAAAKQEGGSFDFKVDVPGTGMYFLGLDPSYGTLIVLGEEDEVKIEGSATSLNAAKIISPVNEAVKAFTDQAFMNNNQLQNLNQQLYYARQAAPGNVPALMNQINAKTIANQNFLDSVSKGSGFVAKLAGFFKYKPFGPEMQQKYGSEIEYYKEEYFNYLDFKDPMLAYIPYFAGNISQYFEALAGNGVATAEILKKYSDLGARLGTENVENIRIFNLAALTGLSSGNPTPNPDAFLAVFEAYKKNNPSDSKLQFWTQRSEQLLAEKKNQARLGEGGEAPEIALPDQNGNVIKLSSLRGKVVLIDFWASWCGPCRMENPNVVRVYKQYKDKGFEILGVSLDRDKQAWLDAIAKDGLTWKHVSDLKYWQSEAAKTYNVTGIPLTVLIDKDGKIIAKNLRGPALEAKLKQLFN